MFARKSHVAAVLSLLVVAGFLAVVIWVSGVG